MEKDEAERKKERPSFWSATADDVRLRWSLVSSATVGSWTASRECYSSWIVLLEMVELNRNRDDLGAQSCAVSRSVSKLTYRAYGRLLWGLGVWPASPIDALMIHSSDRCGMLAGAVLSSLPDSAKWTTGSG